MPQPGWYEDPAGAARLRWWNGEGWTHDLRDRPVPAAPAAQPVVATIAAEPVTAQPVAAPQVPNVPAIPVPPWVSQPASAASGPPSAVAAPPLAPFSRDPEARRATQAGAWGSATTASVWYVALYPAIALIAGLIGAVLALSAGSGARAGAAIGITPMFLVLGWIVAVFVAKRDRTVLRRRGYTDLPSINWLILVPPIVYLAVRRSKIVAQGGRATAPLAAGIAVFALLTALNAGSVALPTLLAGPSAFSAAGSYSGDEGAGVGTSESDPGNGADPSLSGPLLSSDASLAGTPEADGGYAAPALFEQARAQVRAGGIDLSWIPGREPAGVVASQGDLIAHATGTGPDGASTAYVVVIYVDEEYVGWELWRE